METGAIYKDEIRKFSLKTAGDYSKNIKANANFSYSGWGPVVQASFTAEHNLSY